MCMNKGPSAGIYQQSLTARYTISLTIAFFNEKNAQKNVPLSPTPLDGEAVVRISRHRLHAEKL